MGMVHNMEDYIKINFYKCDYTKSKRIAKEDIRLLVGLDKILENMNELNEYWFNVNYDLKLLREAIAEKLRSK